jgi:hypothetical protein
MIKAPMLAFAALTAVVPLSAREIARKCDSIRPPQCNYIFVDKDVRKGASADERTASVVGPYLNEYQALVPSREAPFKAVKTRDGGQIVFTLAFEKEFRLAGPIFVMYFLDRSGKVTLRSEGDLHLEAVQLTELLPARNEFLVVSMRSESGISYTTEVWALGQSKPKKAYFDGGVLESVEKGSASRKGRILLDHEDERTILSWDERKQQMTEVGR